MTRIRRPVFTPALLAIALVAILCTAAEGTTVQKCVPWTPYTSDGSTCVTYEVKNGSPSNSSSSQDVTVTFADGTSQSTTITAGGATVLQCNITSIVIHERSVTNGTSTAGPSASGSSAGKIKKCNATNIYMSDGTVCINKTLTNTGSGSSNMTGSVTYANGNTVAINLTPGQSTVINCKVKTISIHETTAASTTWELD